MSGKSLICIFCFAASTLSAALFSESVEEQASPSRTMTERYRIGTVRLSRRVSVNGPRPYQRSVTPEEKRDIAYIVTTLADKSLVELKSKESTINKVGDRVDHVHPLQFLNCIFSDEELKVAMRNVYGRNWVSKKFMDGLIDSLKKENTHGNVLPHAQDFSSRLNVDPRTILPAMQKGEWDEFVAILIKTIPRSGNARRYDM